MVLTWNMLVKFVYFRFHRCKQRLWILRYHHRRDHHHHHHHHHHYHYHYHFLYYYHYHYHYYWDFSTRDKSEYCLFIVHQFAIYCFSWCLSSKTVQILKLRVSIIVLLHAIPCSNFLGQCQTRSIIILIFHLDWKIVWFFSLHDDSFRITTETVGCSTLWLKEIIHKCDENNPRFWRSFGFEFTEVFPS